MGFIESYAVNYSKNDKSVPSENCWGERACPFKN